jgi:hypothetical protein
LRAGTCRRRRSSRRTRRTRRATEQALHRLHAEAGHAQQHLARRGVHVDREALAVGQRPGELRVDIERQHAGRSVGGRGHDLVVLEAVEAHQPVGLVQPVLAHQRRRGKRQRGRAASGIGLKAE